MNESTNNQENKRTPFKVEIEPIKFNALSDSMLITSNDLCKIASEVFRGIFADCEGTRFDLNGNNFSLSAIFNHGKYDDDAIVACTMFANVENTDSRVINKIRQRDNQMQYGDRYQLTENGKDFFKELLMPRSFNNGKPNWNSIVCEFSEQQTRGFYGFGQMVPQYTKVNFIDLGRLCEFLFGSEINGDRVVYLVNILDSVRNQMAMIPGVSNNYMLNVTRISDKEVRAVYEKLGYGSFSNIIR